MNKSNTRRKTQHKYDWLANQLRSRINDNEWKPGQRMPTDNDLIAEYAISRATVNHAMRLLVDEGLIQRKVGHGTTIAERSLTGEMAIILDENTLRDEGSPSYRICAYELMQLLNAHEGWQGKLHFVRITNQFDTPPQGLDLMEPRRRQNVRGVFSFYRLMGLDGELQRLGMPLVYVTTPAESPGVYFDMVPFYQTAMKHLKEAGCRSVGTIWCDYRSILNEPGGRNDIFTAAARTHGLRYSPNWMCFSDQPPITEQLGRKLFREFWNLSEKPDALIVDDDVMANGVVWAAREMGVRFPKDIKLISMSMRGLDFSPDQPITRLEYDPSLLAKHAVDMMEKVIRKEHPLDRNVAIAPTLIVGDTT